MKRLAILGAGGHGRVVADAAASANWSPVVFYDDAWPERSVSGAWPVVGRYEDFGKDGREYDGVVVGIGHNLARLARIRQLTESGAALVSIVHAAAVISPWATVGPGTVICAGAVVNPYARLGAGCIVNTCASVDHDCELADGVHVSPGAHVGGGVRIGEASWIGIGASVRHDIAIGPGVVVGAGAAVVTDIAGGLTVAGTPARPLVRHPPERDV